VQFAFNDVMPITLNATKFCASASLRYMAMCRAAVAFAVLPTPDSSFRCEGGSCSMKQTIVLIYS
jgi:hypothetical protein